jgi:hypothetical protein
MPEERNPLARALDELAAGARYTIPVEQVRAAVRRRRARRTGATSAVAVVVVATVAGGVSLGLPGRGGSPTGVVPGPGPSTRQGTAADWPAQFLRCGQVVGDALPHLGGDVPVTVTDASSSIPADGPWSASVTVDVPAAPADASAVVWGTDLSVVRNGVVVGVQEGPATPDLSWSLAERLGPDGYLPTSPFPVTTRVTRTLASCDQYPDGRGSPYLEPGTYTLVVTQTLSYAIAPAADPALVDVRSSLSTTVTIAAPTAGADADPGATAAATSATTPASSSAAPGGTGAGTWPIAGAPIA